MDLELDRMLNAEVNQLKLLRLRQSFTQKVDTYHGSSAALKGAHMLRSSSGSHSSEGL